MTIKNIMVIGAGQMGAGIAQVFAQAGFHVFLNDQNEEAVERGMSNIKHHLSRSVERERITETEQTETLERLKKSARLHDAQAADLIIEAVVEDVEVKLDIFKELDGIAPEHAILATNTSSLPITKIAAATNRPDQVIGMHFMNPVPVMKLVEIIRGLQTSDKTFETIEEMAKKVHKTPVEVNDFPGFAANRILMPMINEAIYTVYEGVASVEDVDTVMTLGMNHPMGPLTLADFIGLDTCLAIMEVLYEGFGDSKYRPCPLLKNYVRAGWLGKKSGRGFYEYN